ncbi:MAG: hypothetical protein AM324_013530 [Candidatus Thorarchaeota archaeon SMTZ1-83]
MLYESLSNAYQEIENTSGSLEKTRILSEVFKEAGASEVRRVVVSLKSGSLRKWLFR